MNKHIPQALIALSILTAGLRADEPRPFAHPDRIRYDGHCLTVDGKDMFIYSGAFHYFRCPKELWPQRFQTIKDAGFNTVETYTAWNYHEEGMPKSTDDFSQITKLDELDDWLTMAEKFGFYVIVRPGPYICAEWDNGGFPRWLSALEKPAKPLRAEAWLRTDDPVYLAWCKHWLDAVCPVIAKHQITRKEPGQPGVILFQIENEYDGLKIVSNEEKVNCLTALVKDAQGDGIDVPLFTCFTSQPHAVTSGPLRAVFDCTNYYPRMNIEKSVGPMIDKLHKAQPDAPQATTELQGGWFSEMGGKLSDKQDGLTPQQIQNLTLFAWQHGDTLTNYYMLFGGSNFGDWGGRGQTTTYDYNAPIREDGGVSERYQRVYALGQVVREHGASMTRTDAVEISASASDSDVEIAERRAQDGSRYFFVRTENKSAARQGTAKVTEKDGTAFNFDYQLEPFGSMMLYLAAGAKDANQGEWLPKAGPEIKQSASLPAAIEISEEAKDSESSPIVWNVLKPGMTPESLGYYGSHFLYYKVKAIAGSALTFEVQPKDGLAASAGGAMLAGTVDKKRSHYTFTMPAGQSEMVLLFDDLGHPNYGPTVGQPKGILSMQGVDKTAPVEMTSGDGKFSEQMIESTRSNPEPRNLHFKIAAPIGAATAPSALVTWYRMRFTLPDQSSDVFMPWHLHMEAKGNGFIYINGHFLGRYWQAGPQHDYYLPENWLNFGAGKLNGIAIELRPVDTEVGITAASVAPDGAYSVVASK